MERIELYDRFVNQTVAEMRLQLGERALDRELWAQIRDAFAAQIEGLPDNEFTKTFFSSITRRSFGTVGVAPEIEFVATELDPLASITSHVDTNTYLNRGSLQLLLEDLLGDLHFRSPWTGSSTRASRTSPPRSREHLQVNGERRAVEKIEIIRPVFYQFTRAYIVGEIDRARLHHCRSPSRSRTPIAACSSMR